MSPHVGNHYKTKQNILYYITLKEYQINFAKIHNNAGTYICFVGQQLGDFISLFSEGRKGQRVVRANRISRVCIKPISRNAETVLEVTRLATTSPSSNVK